MVTEHPVNFGFSLDLACAMCYANVNLILGFMCDELLGFTGISMSSSILKIQRFLVNGSDFSFPFNPTYA